MKILVTIEENVHHFLHNVKAECQETKQAGLVIRKYLKEGKISDEEEKILKVQLADSLKIVGIGVPFVLIPGASIIMPILIRVAEKHNIELMPSAFRKKEE